MKLLLIGPYPIRNNGMSEYIAQYRDELTRQGHEVHTACLYFWRHKLSLFKWLIFLRHLSQGFDAILIQHTPTASGPLVSLFLAAAKKLRVITGVIGHEPPSIYAKHLPSWLRPLYHAYEKQVFNLASVRIVHTSFHARELLALGVKDDIRVIPIPLYGLGSPTPSLPSKPTGSAWGYYGMISPKKGVDILLKAYQSRPAGHYPPLNLIGGPAPGEDAYFAALKKQVNASHQSHIRFMGYVEDEKMPEALSALQLMIFPYRWVSQSAALAQTCQYRIPYLASRLPYFEEFHARYGCGSLFDSESVEALAQALDLALVELPGGINPPFEALNQTLSLPQCTRQLVEVLSNAIAAR